MAWAGQTGRGPCLRGRPRDWECVENFLEGSLRRIEQGFQLIAVYRFILNQPFGDSVQLFDILAQQLLPLFLVFSS